MACAFYLSEETKRNSKVLTGGLGARIQIKSPSEVARELSAREGISESTARTYLYEVTDETEFVRKLSPSSSARHELQLRRLRTLYEILGISPDDEIFSRTRQINPQF